jgi:5-methyltetrahydrofolate--homocysteine methyltransferase
MQIPDQTMKKHELHKRLGQEILILDGAIGTMLQPHVSSETCYEMVAMEQPELLRQIHMAYIRAGADIINTNTLGANRIKLGEFGAANEVETVNIRASQLAKEAAGSQALVAGNIGPTGTLIEPAGALSFDQAFSVFKEQAEALVLGGVDLFNLETFSDLKEIKIAILAIQSVSLLPVMAAMTFEETFLTFTGTDPVTAANVLCSLNVDVLGVNCSTGPASMLEVIGRYLQSTHIPVYVEPNAGIPRSGKGNSYQVSPDEMAHYSKQFVSLGANIVGSCCGSTPEYTAAIRNAVKSMHPVSRQPMAGLCLSSRTQSCVIGPEKPFSIIGERLNPTNRPELTEALKKGRISLLQQEAKAQVSEGAHLLDVNIGVPGLKVEDVMSRVMRGIENVCQVPLVIDSTDPEAIEAALKETAGKVLINSVHGSAKSMETIIPLAARYGAGLLCLAVGEKGIPKTAEQRLDVLRKIIENADEAGIPRNHLICDCLTLTISAEQKRAESTLKAIEMVKQELGLPTVLGVSNISYGLPERSLINATFLSMAMAAGLDAAIMNPGDPRMMETVRAASVLTVRDKDSKDFIASHQKKKKKETASEAPSMKKEVTPIYQAVISGNRDEIETLVQKAIDGRIPALTINNEMLIPAIQEVGKQYDRKEIFLPQMILAAETMQRAFSVLRPHFKGVVKSAGKIIICTVKGDVHDIGKNIVSLFLGNEGFDILDLGKNVPAEEIVRQAQKNKPDVVALSALMTTTMVEMPKVVDKLKKAGIEVKIIIGGAVVTKTYAGEIGADGYAKDAMQAVQVVKALIEDKEDGKQD